VPLTLSRLIDARRAWIVLAVALACSFVATLYFSRGTTFSGDEMVWVITSPALDLSTLLTPHGGHLQLVSRSVYKVMLELFGLSYLPYRVLTALAVCLAATLLFVWLKRRVAPVVALLPCLVLLFFGSDPLHSLQGNGFTIVFSIAMGLAGLLLIEHNSRRADIGAAVALTVGVATYSVAIPLWPPRSCCCCRGPTGDASGYPRFRPSCTCAGQYGVAWPSTRQKVATQSS
jgi:hypothetical protein